MNLGAASPSIGSRLHGSDCKPCAWFWKKGGCLNGAECRHCHSCTYGELSRRKSENRRRNRRRGFCRATKNATVEAWKVASPQHEGAEGKIDEGPEGKQLALPGTAGLACELLELPELPSPEHYGFKRSVTSPTKPGRPLIIEDLPVRSMTAPAVAGPSSMSSYPDVEPWELPSPQHSGFHRSVTEPASVEGALQKRPQCLQRAATDPAVCHREGGPSLPAVMIIVPVPFAMVPMVINRM